MRINHNISSMIGHGALHAQNSSLTRSLEKLSTGLRINRASDDAAGLSVSESLRSKVRGMERGKENARDGIALLQIADGAAGQINEILQRLRELLIQGANDTMVTSDRIMIERQLDHLVSEVDRIASSASYNGMTLLDGSAGSFGAAGSGSSVLHIGAGSGAAANRIAVDVLPLTSGSLNLHSGWWDNALNFSLTMDVGAGITYSVPLKVTNSHYQDIFGTHILRNANQRARNSLTNVDTAIASVNTMRSNVGAYVNRLEFAIADLENQIYNSQDAESRIRDVDFAKETTEFTRSQILAKSATSMLAQANQVPQGVLALLGS